MSLALANLALLATAVSAIEAVDALRLMAQRRAIDATSSASRAALILCLAVGLLAILPMVR
ncbi:hypothetical protein ABE438_17640 [Bosea sp. TWI1241]|uniref:hypothetical protein n=1 Tax=Bosea sp. TWI1241 TaxID=3148904 RepID=UPI00320B635D